LWKRVLVEALLLLVVDDAALEGPSAVGDAKLGVENEGCTRFESERRLKDEVLQACPMISMICPMVGANVGDLYWPSTKGVPEVAECVAGDRRTWNLKVKARTRDTDLDRFGPLE